MTRCRTTCLKQTRAIVDGYVCMHSLSAKAGLVIRIFWEAGQKQAHNLLPVNAMPQWMRPRGCDSIQQPRPATAEVVSLSSISATGALSRQKPVRGFYEGNIFTLRLQDGTPVQVEVCLGVAGTVGLRKSSKKPSTGPVILFSIRSSCQLQRPTPLRPTQAVSHLAPRPEPPQHTATPPQPAHYLVAADPGSNGPYQAAGGISTHVDMLQAGRQISRWPGSQSTVLSAPDFLRQTSSMHRSIDGVTESDRFYRVSIDSESN